MLWLQATLSPRSPQPTQPATHAAMKESERAMIEKARHAHVATSDEESRLRDERAKLREAEETRRRQSEPERKDVRQQGQERREEHEKLQQSKLA